VGLIQCTRVAGGFGNGGQDVTTLIGYMLKDYKEKLIKENKCDYLSNTLTTDHI
jgi:hypothetical protein